MAVAAKRRVTAASARAHTRNKDNKSSLHFSFSGVWPKSLALIAAIFIAWGYKAILPPPPKICGSPNGPPVTASRVRLRDGRYLAYKEAGVPKERANYKIVTIHAYGRSRHDVFPASKELVEKLGVYFVSFDRAGYGQSDPFPGRTVKSEAYDIQELADHLQLGQKFYITSFSIGGYSAWACLKYIPERLAGAALVCPVANYFWPGIPPSEALKAYLEQPFGDQLAVGIAHYVPFLTYFWMTQKLFPTSSTVQQRTTNVHDLKLREILTKTDPAIAKEPTQQGASESQYRDMKVMFGNWEFSPADLENPFSNGNGSVHTWQGDDDLLVNVRLQRYIHSKLPWIHYHDLPGMGHILLGVKGLPDKILTALLLKDQELSD